jgi:hypothetical protein
METIDKVVDYINVQRDRFVEELKEYLAIPSISALPEHQGDVGASLTCSASDSTTQGSSRPREIRSCTRNG